jgi:hypothetical protein
MCHACGQLGHNDIFQENLDDPEGTEICIDKKVIHLFKQTVCLSCGSKKGIVKM